MIGIVIVTHGRLGAELITTAEFILGRIENAHSVSIDVQSSPETMRKQIEQAIKKADHGQGVLLLTDMFGGTPSNLSLSFLAAGKVEVLTGVNLPMLIKLTQSRDGNLKETAQAVGEYGRKSITVAGELLNRRTQS